MATSGKVITIGPTDVTLWHIAARYLGDATQANRIMNLNGLTDTWITSTMQITLPAYDLSQGGGVSSQ